MHSSETAWAGPLRFTQLGKVVIQTFYYKKFVLFVIHTVNQNIIPSWQSIILRDSVLLLKIISKIFYHYLNAQTVH